jgi:K+/H+ antiporter YhaU regulatory subunit KhtT
MLAAASLLVVVLLALLVMRVATAVLTMTGLSRESARFQVRSALTGVGFTTSETESVVNHPVRRRVVMTLMLVGSAGVITAVTTLIISFARTDREGALLRILVLVGGLVALLFLARSATFDRLLQRLIARVLARYTDLDVRDYAALLHISGEYAVAELLVEPGDWVAERRLDELDLPEEGLRVLGIEQSGGVYLGAPDGDTTIRPGDTLILYGRADAVAEIDRRKAGPTGDAEHLDAVEEERVLVED